MEGSTPLVRADINGVQVSLIPSSGDFYSMLSSNAAAELKLPSASASGVQVIGVGGIKSISVTTVKTLKIADQTVSNASFIVMVNQFSHGIVGTIGQNILGVADVYYDFPDGLIRLTRASGCGDQTFVVWDSSRAYSKIALQSKNGNFKQTVAQATINGKAVRVRFDSGSARSFLSLAAARRIGIDPVSTSVTDRGDFPSIGQKVGQSWMVPIGIFKIGDEEIRNTRMIVESLPLPDEDLVLGADFFLSHRVYVANSQGRIYFTYVGGPVFRLETPAAGSVVAKTAVEPKEISTEPADADEFSRRGTALAGRRQFSLALADLTQATILAPKQAKYFTERGRIYLGAGQPGLARTDLDTALRLDPDDSLARFTRAWLRADSDKPGALADLAELDRSLPKDAALRLDMASVYERAEAGAAAISQVDLWIKNHPDDYRTAWALNARCWDRALFNIEPDKGLADCDAAIRRGSLDADFHDSRGLAHLRLGHYDQAIADYDAALAARPKLAWSHYGRGLAKLRKGETNGGTADLAAAAALDPKLPALAKAHGFTP